MEKNQFFKQSRFENKLSMTHSVDDKNQRWAEHTGTQITPPQSDMRKFPRCATTPFPPASLFSLPVPDTVKSLTPTVEKNPQVRFVPPKLRY